MSPFSQTHCYFILSSVDNNHFLAKMSSVFKSVGVEKPNDQVNRTILLKLPDAVPLWHANPFLTYRLVLL